MPSTSPLTQSQADVIRELMTLPESFHLEFKRVSGKMVGKALETVCAFANAGGGNLILGLADPKEFAGASRLFGIEENPEAVDELQRKLLTEFSPSIDMVRLTRLPCMLHKAHLPTARPVTFCWCMWTAAACIRSGTVVRPREWTPPTGC